MVTDEDIQRKTSLAGTTLLLWIRQYLCKCSRGYYHQCGLHLLKRRDHYIVIVGSSIHLLKRRDHYIVIVGSSIPL